MVRFDVFNGPRNETHRHSYNRKFVDKTKSLSNVFVSVCKCVYWSTHSQTANTLTEYISVLCVSASGKAFVCERQRARQYSYGWFDVYVNIFLRVSLEIRLLFFSCIGVVFVWKVWLFLKNYFYFFLRFDFAGPLKISNGSGTRQRQSEKAQAIRFSNCRQLVFLFCLWWHKTLRFKCLAEGEWVCDVCYTHSCHFCCSYSPWRWCVWFVFSPLALLLSFSLNNRTDMILTSIPSDSKSHNVYWLHCRTFMLRTWNFVIYSDDLPYTKAKVLLFM